MVLDAFQDNPSQTQLEVQLMNNRAAHGVVSGSKEVCALGCSRRPSVSGVVGGRFD
jgi:hypothetical protein